MAPLTQQIFERAKSNWLYANGTCEYDLLVFTLKKTFH